MAHPGNNGLDCVFTICLVHVMARCCVSKEQCREGILPQRFAILSCGPGNSNLLLVLSRLLPPSTTTQLHRLVHWGRRMEKQCSCHYPLSCYGEKSGHTVRMAQPGPKWIKAIKFLANSWCSTLLRSCLFCCLTTEFLYISNIPLHFMWHSLLWNQRVIVFHVTVYNNK